MPRCRRPGGRIGSDRRDTAATIFAHGLDALWRHRVGAADPNASATKLHLAANGSPRVATTWRHAGSTAVRRRVVLASEPYDDDSGRRRRPTGGGNCAGVTLTALDPERPR